MRNLALELLEAVEESKTARTREDAQTVSVPDAKTSLRAAFAKIDIEIPADSFITIDTEDCIKWSFPLCDGARLCGRLSQSGVLRAQFRFDTGVTNMRDIVTWDDMESLLKFAAPEFADTLNKLAADRRKTAALAARPAKPFTDIVANDGSVALRVSCNDSGWVDWYFYNLNNPDAPAVNVCMAANNLIQVRAFFNVFGAEDNPPTSLFGVFYRISSFVGNGLLIVDDGNTFVFPDIDTLIDEWVMLSACEYIEAYTKWEVEYA